MVSYMSDKKLRTRVVSDFESQRLILLEIVLPEAVGS